jgi:hypothetical protein
LWALYAAWPDALTNFDGVMFSGIISERSVGWRSALFQYAGHYLFNPTAWLFYRGLSAVRPGLPGFASIHLMNALLAAASATLLFLALRDWLDESLALPLALLTAVGANVWERAAECSVYTPALFFTTAAFAALLRYLRSGRRTPLLLSAAAVGVSSLYHLVHAFWTPAFLVAVLVKKKRDAALFLGVCAATGLIPQVAAFRLWTAAAWRSWYMNMGSASVTTWGHHPGRVAVHFPWRSFADAGTRVLWSWPPREASWPLAAAFFAAAAAASYLAVRLLRPSVFRDADREGRGLFAFAATLPLCVFCFQTLSVWEHLPRYVGSLALACVAAAVGLLRAVRGGRAVGAALWILASGTAIFNAAGTIVPDSRWEKNETLQNSFALARMTPPGSLLVVDGFTRNARKVYLTGLCGRGLLTMDHYLIRFGKRDALERIRAWIVKDLESGTPIYVPSDVLQGRFLEGLPPEWGMTRADLDSIFSPFELQNLSPPTADPGVRRLWPRRAPADLWRRFAERSRELGRRREAAFARERGKGRG